MKYAVLAALTTLAGGALADAPTVPAFATLPQGAVSGPPATKAPAHVAASEKVPGFYLTMPEPPPRLKKKNLPTPPRFVQLFASEDDAKAAPRGVPRKTEVCFAEDEAARFSKKRAALGDDEPQEPRRWSTLQQMLTFNVAPQRNIATGPRAVHAERVVEANGGASLESTDVWVDPETKGVRLIGKTSTPLRLVGAVPSGPRVWAMRVGDDRLELVITQDPQMIARGESLIAISSRGQDDSSSCAHLRVDLKVEKGGAESVSVLAAAELPPLDRGDARAAKSEIRVRPVRVHASATWTTRDAAPVVTVSFGWESRARVQPNPEAEPE
jgi:hypothetical protein